MLSPRSCARLVFAPAILVLASFGCGAPPAPLPPPAASPVEDVEPKAEMSSLEILCNPPTDVAIDGKKIGTTPIKNHKIEPGKHDVTFLDVDTGNRTMTVEVGPGEGKTVISDRPPNPNAGPPAAAPPKKK
ncbi:MAG: PEGA domain-containing protein [Minicystis sp.]